MKNLIREYGLVSKTGKYSPESEKRRDVIAALLTEEGDIPSDMTMMQYNDLVEKKYKELGLSVPDARDVHIGLERGKLTFAAKWIMRPEQRKRRSEVPKYLQPVWDALQTPFPIANGGPPLIEEAAPPPAPEPPPEATVEEVPMVNPARALAEAHTRIFVSIAAEYEKIFSQIFLRLEKLESAGLVRKAPPLIPENVAEPLPEAPRRYFEYDMPEKTDWGLVIRYTERFRRSYKKTPAGLHWMIAKAMETLAKKGMRYPGLGTTKMNLQNKSSVLDRPNCRTYEIRVQRTWRVIINVDSAEKIIWTEVVASHNDKQFYER
jgi:hypothetical protein